MSGPIRLLAFSVLLAFGSIWAAGQDLGSSNKLFGGSKGNITPASAKKGPPKKKPSTAKRKTPVPAKSSTAKAPSKSEQSPSKRPEKAVAKGETRTQPNTVER